MYLEISYSNLTILGGVVLETTVYVSDRMSPASSFATRWESGDFNDPK